MFLKIEIEGLEELKGELAGRFLARLDRNIQDALKTSAHKVEADAVNLAAGSVYKGEFMEKIAAEFPEPFRAEIGSSAPHAPFVELDTRPHFPWNKQDDVNPMIEYAHIKLRFPYKGKGKKEGKTAEQVGFLLARKISRVGTKGQHIFLKAGTQNEEIIEKIFIKAVGDAING